MISLLDWLLLLFFDLLSSFLGRSRRTRCKLHSFAGLLIGVRYLRWWLYLLCGLFGNYRLHCLRHSSILKYLYLIILLHDFLGAVHQGFFSIKILHGSDSLIVLVPSIVVLIIVVQVSEASEYLIFREPYAFFHDSQPLLRVNSELLLFRFLLRRFRVCVVTRGLRLLLLDGVRDHDSNGRGLALLDSLELAL